MKSASIRWNHDPRNAACFWLKLTARMIVEVVFVKRNPSMSTAFCLCTCAASAIYGIFSSHKLWLCMQADSPEQRAVAIEAAAQAIQATLQWRQKRKFLSPQQLSAWEPLVSTSRPFLPYDLGHSVNTHTGIHRSDVICLLVRAWMSIATEI